MSVAEDLQKSNYVNRVCMTCKASF